MGNWFQNALSSINDVGTTLASGVSQQLSGVIGGVVGGATQAVGGGTGIQPNNLGIATNYGNQGAFSPGGIGGSSFNVGSIFGANLGGGSSTSTSSSTSSGGGFQSFFEPIPRRDTNGNVVVENGQTVYVGFWSYWNKPKNIRFYGIWGGGILFIWAAYQLLKPSPKPRKKVKKATGGARKV